MKYQMKFTKEVLENHKEILDFLSLDGIVLSAKSAEFIGKCLYNTYLCGQHDALLEQWTRSKK